LKNFRKLETLKIGYNGDLEEIENFSDLQRLERLELIYNPERNHPIDSEGMKKLRNMLPDTEVILKDRGW
jgi:hypothetical protein